MSWVKHEDEETWREVFETLAHVDTFIVKESHALKLVKTKPLKSGKVGLTYSTNPE
jgi:hypothetical protein